ncbi:MAG: recombinase family protein [Ahrensia sp.]|nr:recombinase family protein [Ahrensia sp.]
MISAKEDFQPGTKAVIYCRVSSSKQSKVGDGLGSQQTRCREYARYKGLEVVETFTDDMSGSLTTRPGMKAMLTYLDKHRGKEPIIVIIDDISRLARGMEAHLQLRSAIGEAGGILKSPTIEFGEDSDSILVENMLASVSQHQRQKNAEQTINRMRARTMNGYWCFQAPIGYRYQRTAGHGNLLVRDEPHASILQEALEGFAAGRFQTQSEMRRFLENHPDYPSDLPNGEIRNQRITDLLTRPIYAGYVEAPKWNVSLRKGHHEGLISFETFEKIQERLKAGAYAPARKDINEDFPLRGFVECGDCSKPLTACWSKSSTGKKHPYYLCYNKGCDSYRKSIPRDKIEGQFEAILQSMQPSKNLVSIAKVMFKHAWSQRLEQFKVNGQTIERDLAAIDPQIDQLLDRIVAADNDRVIDAYENKIAKLERQKLVLTEKLANFGKPKHGFDEMFELAMRFLSNPWKLWVSGQLHLRKTVLRLGFIDRIAYHRERGFSNVKKSLPFNILGGNNMMKMEMAHPPGFEPGTPRFVV